jgi:hypothetical protein
VLENGLVRLSGTGQEVLEHPEIGALYLGGAVSTETGDPAGGNGAGGDQTGTSAANGAAPGAAR